VKESTPPGDIPDNQAFVSYTSTAGGFSVKIPEGWARKVTPQGAQFTDRLNTVEVLAHKTGHTTTVDEVKQQTQPALGTGLTGYKSTGVTQTTLTAGSAIRATYSATGVPDQVTGKSVRDDVLVYTIHGSGREAVLALIGAHGSDNVDPWKIVADSFRWSK